MYIEPAGQMTRKGQFDNTRACMEFTEPPRTPPEVRMFRRSAKLQPGTRYQNHKQVEDSAALRLPDRKFGVTSDSSNENTAALISAARPSILQKIKDEQAEALYKNANREPLGKGYVRGTVLPEKFNQGTPFGAPPQKVPDNAKALLFPNNVVPPESEEIYIRSHGSYAPGAQINRGYKWNHDPAKTVFGRKGDTIALNGVSKNVEDVLKGSLEDRGNLVNSKTVEDMRSLGDLLGKPRNLGHKRDLPPDFVFGCSSGKNEWSAADTIRGEYPTDDDPELGKSLTPGFRNITHEERAFGCPSIRTDLPMPKTRSVADPQNYGDDSSAKELISPAPFSDLNFELSAFETPVKLERLLLLFSRFPGVPKLPTDVAEYCFQEASTRGGYQDLATFNDFRDVANDYFDALETGRERDWRRIYLNQ